MVMQLAAWGAVVIAASIIAQEIPHTEHERFVDPDEQYYEDLDTLATTVYLEAGNQDTYGCRLVADVILNRMASDSFPDTVDGVVFQRGQFSVATDRYFVQRNKNKVPDWIYAVCEEEIEEQTDYEILYFQAGGYHRDCGTPAYRYGDHYFSK